MISHAFKSRVVRLRTPIGQSAAGDQLEETVHRAFDGSQGGEWWVDVAESGALKGLRRVLDRLPPGVIAVLNVKGTRVGLLPDLTAFGKKGVIHQLALLGPRPAVHDGLTGQKGQYARLLKSALAHSQAGLGLRIHTTVIKGGFRNLPEFPALCRQLRIPRLLVEVPYPTESLMAMPSTGPVRYPLLDLPLARMAAQANRAGLKFSIRGVPPCTLGQAQEMLTPHLAPPFTTEVTAHWAEGQWRLEETTPAFTAVEHCQTCPQAGLCPGVPQTYLDTFTSAEFEAPALAASPMAS